MKKKYEVVVIDDFGEVQGFVSASRNARKHLKENDGIIVEIYSRNGNGERFLVSYAQIRILSGKRVLLFGPVKQK